MTWSIRHLHRAPSQRRGHGIVAVVTLAIGVVAVMALSAGAAVSTLQPRDQPGLVASHGLSRAETIESFRQEFDRTISDSHWSGSVADCDPGELSEAYQTDIVGRIRWYRSMAGLAEPLGVDRVGHPTAQAAALMMAASGTVSHDPVPSWPCYLDEGAWGASQSNLFNVIGAAAIDGYLIDDGISNVAVRHRGWLLLPWLERIGVGEVPSAHSEDSDRGGHALFVSNGLGSGPSRPEPVVVWPPAGYAPYRVPRAGEGSMPTSGESDPIRTTRWSLHVPHGDLRHANVTVRRNGVPIDVTIIARTADHGTLPVPVLVFELHDADLPDLGVDWPVDDVYEVTVTGVDAPMGGSFDWVTTMVPVVLD